MSILALDAKHDANLRIRIPAMQLNEAWVDCCQVRVEIAWAG